MFIEVDIDIQCVYQKRPRGFYVRYDIISKGSVKQSLLGLTLTALARTSVSRIPVRTTAGIRGIARVRAAVVGDVVRPVAPHLDHSMRRQHRITRTLSSQGTSTATRCPAASSTC